MTPMAGGGLGLQSVRYVGFSFKLQGSRASSFVSRRFSQSLKVFFASSSADRGVASHPDSDADADSGSFANLRFKFGLAFGFGLESNFGGRCAVELGIQA